MQRPRRIVAAAIGALAALAWAAAAAGGPPLRTLVPGVRWIFARMPGSYGARGLLALRDGQAGRGAILLLAALGATSVLAALAAFAHQRAFLGEAWARSRSGREPGLSRGRSVAGEVARLFFKQLSASRTVWILQFIPLLMTGIGAYLSNELARALAEGRDVPEVLLSVQPGLVGIPFLAVALFLSVMMNAQVWMNQFGWDRSTIRALLQLPVSPRDILVGKALGLLQLTVLGWLFSGAGLLLAYRPSWRETAGGLAASGFAFVVTTAVGQFVSLQVPRAVPPAGMAPPPPLYLSWIPAALFPFTGLALAGIWGIGSALAPWLGPLLVWAALGGALLAWRGVMPQVERLFLASREKLLSM
jgi:hypothetical protein